MSLFSKGKGRISRWFMRNGLEGIKGVEVGGVAAMPLAGMLMSSWGAEIIHVEPPGRGDIQRHFVGMRISQTG